MICALKSSFYRFFRSGLFAKTILFALLIGLVDIFFINDFWLSYGMVGRPRYLDNYYAANCISALKMLTPFWCGVFASSFTGKDISYRAINNKISVGIHRAKIYLADLAVAEISTILSVITSSAFICLITVIVPSKCGLVINGQLVENVLHMIIICAAFTGIYVLLQYFLGNRVFGLIISLVMIVGVFAGTIIAETKLVQPYRVVVSHEEDSGDAVWAVNEEYIGGVPRTVLTFLRDASPYYSEKTGDVEKMRPEECIAAASVFVLSSAAGITVINKKEFN